MKKREEVDIKETWKIEDLYENDESFYSDLEQTSKLSKEFFEKYKNLQENVEEIFGAIKEYSDILGKMSDLGTFASITTEVDTTNPSLAKRYAKYQAKASDIYATLSFFDVALVNLDKKILDEIARKDENYKYFVEKIKKRKDHTLSLKEEELLKKLSPTFDANYTNYADIRYGDIKIEKVNLADKEIEINHNSFEEYLEADPDTEIRRKAFKNYHDGLRNYQNSTASIYNSHLQNEKTLANIRKFDSVFSYLLDMQDITKDVYDKHLDTIMEKLAPIMRKYAKILQKHHKLDEMTYADLKINIDNDYEPELAIEKAKEYILDGLSVLGEDYSKILQKAFDERWIDYSQNIGKRTGAFAAGAYNVHPFIMTSYNNKMSQVMTLAHELGHAGQDLFTNKNQDFLNTFVSMYFVEAPSTTNEIIMERYLLKKAKDDREKLWVLSTMISKTYYHNFVTHFLEAYYQREVYRLIDEGKSLTSYDLNKIFKETLEKFWQDSVKLNDGAELTWMRQPHYYMGLYPYTYSAGLTIGTKVSEKIVNGDQKDRDNWLDVLKTGGSLSPMDLAKKAGVDMTNTKALEETIEFIGQVVDEIDSLCEKLNMYE